MPNWFGADRSEEPESNSHGEQNGHQGDLIEHRHRTAMRTSVISPQKKMAGKKSRTFLGKLAEHYDALSQPCYEQCAALCYRPAPDGFQVLVVTSRESGRWIIPKGWPIEGKKDYQAAAQEALEEAGIRGKVKKKPFGYFTYLKKLDTGRQVPCIVQVHLLKVDGTEADFRENGQRRREWVSCYEAARRVQEPELKGLLLTLARKRDGQRN
ncbi:NUDIX hydrolase [Rhizobium gallicum]|nr:NUDIX hydrolase [Rhizobium gallicum]